MASMLDLAPGITLNALFSPHKKLGQLIAVAHCSEHTASTTEVQRL